jgi:hypothetical protein
MPKLGETVAGYLNRMVEEGKARGDAHLIIQARSVQRWLATGSYMSSADSPGVSLFAAGQNQEAAGQYLLAIVSYQNALKSGDDAVPAKQIGERLAALKSAHPQEYDQAINSLLGMPRFPVGAGSGANASALHGRERGEPEQQPRSTPATIATTTPPPK